MLRDLDSDNIPELIIKEELKLTVYRYDTEIVEIGNYDFVTGTTRFFFLQAILIIQGFLFLC